MAKETSGRPAEKAEVMSEEATSVADCRGRREGMGEGREGCEGATGVRNGRQAGTGEGRVRMRHGVQGDQRMHSRRRLARIVTACAHLHRVRAGAHGQGGGHDAGTQAQAGSQAAGLQRLGGQAG